MSGRYYILNKAGEPVPTRDMLEAARAFENRSRIVARDTIGDSVASTVFLILDHRYGDDGPPILWETMVFGDPMDQEGNRCAGTREQAEAMHQDMVERVRAIAALTEP